ncbi:hypothetical protein DFH07DRAFT_834304 [Mycena maculata]|uniref:F-box domain-containing protein n=1 Tax=Mycena maculata TaxID=230809 RepID=A0AAD7IJU9_9AGAR|nr:hypothetical protein DFH07DRAFT_834304 [Mycena maculata]
MSLLWEWFVYVTLFRVWSTELRVESTRRLNDDILAEIFARPEIQFEDLLRLSTASRRFRVLLMPRLFGKHTWAPWHPNYRPGFPPNWLWQHIRVFTLKGPHTRKGPLDSAQRDFLVSHLEPAIRSMTAAQTFVVSFIDGGIWPSLLETIAAAPVCTNLVVDNSPWLGDGQDAFDLPPTLGMLPLRQLAYIAPHAFTPWEYFLKPVKRPSRRLESEVDNLCSILRTCRCTLEALTLPGELVLRSLDSSLGWRSLRELYIAGYWPDPADASLLSILLMMPNLRIVSLRWRPTVPSQHFYVAPRDILPSFLTSTFLPRLQQLEIASLSPGDQMISILPRGMEKLVVTEYPTPRDLFRHPQNILRASEFLGMLLGVHLPAVTHLELWYKTDIADEQLLRHLPLAFPSLQYLEVRRFVTPEMDATWNPGHILQEVLSELKHLRVFALEPDPPERRDRAPPPGIDHKYARYIRRLKALAEEIVQLAPWTQAIQMYVQIDDESIWKRWEVVAVPGEPVRLHSRSIPSVLYPEIHAIMEDGPVEAPEIDSDSD